MSRFSTDRAWAAAALVAGAAVMGTTTWLAAGGGAEIDPRTIEHAEPMRYGHQLEPSIQPARGDYRYLETAEPPPAPLGELDSPTGPAADAERTLQPAGDHLNVVIGHNAGQSIDKRIVRRFDREREEVELKPVACTDREVIEMLMIGRADFGLIGGKVSRRERQAGMRKTRIAVELFGLSVSPKMEVRSLSREQIRKVFTGEVTRWEDIGFEGGKITPIVPSEPRLAERAQKALMPGDKFADSCVRVPTERHVVDQLLQHPGGVAVLRLTEQPREAGQKVIQIEWNPATPEAYALGNYPFGIELNLVTSGKAKGVALDLVDYMLSGRGRELLAKTHCFLP